MLGVLKKYGKPELSKEFFQRVIFDDNFQGLGYLGVLALIGTSSFILNIPMVITAYLVIADVGKGFLDANPNHRLLSLFKEQITKGVQVKG